MTEQQTSEDPKISRVAVLRATRDGGEAFRAGKDLPEALPDAYKGSGFGSRLLAYHFGKGFNHAASQA